MGVYDLCPWLKFIVRGPHILIKNVGSSPKIIIYFFEKFLTFIYFLVILPICILSVLLLIFFLQVLMLMFAVGKNFLKNLKTIINDTYIAPQGFRNIHSTARRTFLTTKFKSGSNGSIDDGLYASGTVNKMIIFSTTFSD